MFSQAIQHTGSYLKNKLNSGLAAPACVGIAILNKCLISWLYADLSGDKSLYLLLTRGFLQIGVLAEPVKLVETGATVYLFDYAIHSPLYSLLCAPFLWLTNSYFLTQLLISFLGWIIFFTGLYKLALLVLKERWIVNLFILCTGFYLYPHELDSTPKDTLSMAFLFWSIYFLHSFIYKKPGWKNTGWLAASLACLCLMKLLYIPLAAILMLLLFVFILKDKPIKGIIYFGVLCGLLLLIGLLVYFLIFSPAYELAKQSSVALLKSEATTVKGFYPKNILQTYPFIVSSVINTNFWGVQLEKLFNIPFSQWMQVFRFVDVFLVFLLIVPTVFRRRLLANRLGSLIIGVAITMVCVLFYLSLTTQPTLYKSGTTLWTFVGDARSFLFPMVGLQFLLFLFVYRSERFKFIRFLLFGLFAFECLHGLYFTIKQSVNADAVIAAKNTNDPSKKITGMLTKNDHIKNQVGLITTDNSLRRYADINGVLSLALTNEPANLSWMKKGNSYLVAVHSQDSLLLKKFPSKTLQPADSISPFVLHLFTAE